MVCGSSYNYNMPGFKNGTSFMPFYGSSTGFLGGSSIFTQMFGGAMGGCNPFMTSYAQPNFNAMAGWAVADSLLNMSTMFIGAAIQDRKDNSVENTYEDIELLKEKKADKEAEKKDVDNQLSELDGKSSGLNNDVAYALRDLEGARQALENFNKTNEKDLANPKADNYDELHKEKANLQKAVDDRQKDYDDAQKKLDEHTAKVAELQLEQKELQAEIKTLESQIRTADEKADRQVLDKLLKRKNCSKYSEVGSKFDGNNSLITGKEVSTADAWAVVNAYRNTSDDKERVKYAQQFKAIYDALEPEDQGEFHSVYKLMRDNHSRIF